MNLGGAQEFEDRLRSLLDIADRQIGIRIEHRLGGPARYYERVYVNFINLPAGVGGAGGGAEAENNRMSFWIEGFDGTDPHAPPPRGVVKVELHNSALPRSVRLRAKTGKPEAIAKYLADFLNRVVREVPPNFTHTRNARRGRQPMHRNGRLQRNGIPDEATIVNSSEVENYADAKPGSVGDGGPLFRLAFGAYHSTILYVWAESLEDAFEEAVEWLDDNEPGHLTTVTEDDYRRAAEDEGVEWKASWPDWEDSAFERVAQAAEADLTSIGHTTLKHGTHIPSWEWAGSAVTDREEYAETVAESWADGVELDVSYERFGPNEDEPTSGLRISTTNGGKYVEITQWTDVYDATGDPESEGDILRDDITVSTEELFSPKGRHRGTYSGDDAKVSLADVLRMAPPEREKAVVNAAIACIGYGGGEESHVSYVGE